MINIELLQALFIALALGALVGLEREYARHRKRGHDFAGIRTFPLIALFGALAAYLGEVLSLWILIISILLMGVLVILAYYSISSHSRVHLGATSEVAAFLTFFVGILCYNREYTLAAVIAVVMTLILYARSVLHSLAEKISKEELASTLKFAVIALVVLPFLPNEGYGPYGLFNPYIFWLVVVFVLGVGFFGYIMLKWMREKGILLEGFFGGLVSSVVVTSNFAERSRKERKIVQTLIVGAVIANAVMFARMLFLVFAFNQELFYEIVIPMLVLMAVSGIFSYLLLKKMEKTEGKLVLGSPFRFVAALKFSLLFVGVMALIKIAEIYLPYQGVYLISFLSGLVNVDAITVSLSQYSGNGMALEIAKNGLLIAALANVAVKGGIAYWMGERKNFGRTIAVFFAALIVLGCVFFFL
jgi:uncharacterized membrane protein (DUF4010 family)